MKDMFYYYSIAIYKRIFLIDSNKNIFNQFESWCRRFLWSFNAGNTCVHFNFMIAFGNQPEKLNLRWLTIKAGDQRSWKCRRGSTTNGKMFVVISVGEHTFTTYFHIICVWCRCLKLWSVAFIYFFVCGEKG